MSQSNQALAAGQVGSGEVVNAACSAARAKRNVERETRVVGCPTVAKQFWENKRNSPYGNFKVANLSSFAISFATAPAALANCPPLPRDFYVMYGRA